MKYSRVMIGGAVNFKTPKVEATGAARLFAQVVLNVALAHVSQLFNTLANTIKARQPIPLNICRHQNVMCATNQQVARDEADEA